MVRVLSKANYKCHIYINFHLLIHQKRIHNNNVLMRNTMNCLNAQLLY